LTTVLLVALGYVMTMTIIVGNVFLLYIYSII